MRSQFLSRWKHWQRALFQVLISFSRVSKIKAARCSFDGVIYSSLILEKVSQNKHWTGIFGEHNENVDCECESKYLLEMNRKETR